MAANQQLDLSEKILRTLNAPKEDQKVNFFRLIAMTQNAGLGIRESINAINKSEKHGGMRAILQSLISQVSEGNPLADAMMLHPEFFKQQEVALVKSSETMGNLPDTLQSIADELLNMQVLKGKIKAAMNYPMIVLSFAGFAVVVILVKVMPTIVELFPSKDMLPSITKMMLGLSNFLVHYWPLVIFGVAGVAIGYVMLYRFFLPFKIFMDRFMLDAPVVGDISRKFNLYRFAKLLSDFYMAGVSPTTAMQQIADVISNYHYKKKIMSIKKDLQVGLSFTESMEGSWLFPPILVQVISVGEKTGNVGEVLGKMAAFYREEINSKLEGMMKIIEPILMAFVSIIIGGIVAAVFMPMASLISVIGGS